MIRAGRSRSFELNSGKPQPPLDGRSPLVPRHVAVFPDGNRRWARAHGLSVQAGYERAIEPLVEVCREAERLAIPELTIYAMSDANTGRPADQIAWILRALAAFAEQVVEIGLPLRIVGDTESVAFPAELSTHRLPPAPARAATQINLLVNYGWRWDLETAARAFAGNVTATLLDGLASREVSDVDLVVRWGGRWRMSGFLPIQAASAEFLAIPELWPDFEVGQLHRALAWYRRQVITNGR